MNKLELDYSEIEQAAPAALQDSDWEPPQHKFFGKKDARGKMEKEPVYVHQEYPRLMYSKVENRIVAREVRSALERESLGQGWETTPAAFGYVGAPSFEQHLALKKERAQEEAEAKIKEEAEKPAQQAALLALLTAASDPDAPKRGRPAKV